MNLTNPLVYGVPFFVLFIIAELAYSKTHDWKDLYDWKDLGSSAAMGLGSVILAPIVKLVLAGVTFKAVFTLCNTEISEGVYENFLGYESFGWSLPVWFACQFLDDFSYYWFHRLNHTVRLLWAAHIVHHSSDHYNYGTGIRNGWFTLLYKPFFYMWLPAIGFHYEMVLFCLGIEALWQFQLHTQYMPKLGFLEKFMNTHTMHQAHHAQNFEYLDKNHGGYLNMFDKIFGSWVELEDNIDVKYGVIHAPDSNNPFIIVSHEYKDIWNDVKKSKSTFQAFMYVFGPPGWSPDGSTLTVRQMQREQKQELAAEKNKSTKLETA
jgi:sterol desaturase/sphingolipid hydroxylase (fatty acid hydroxylase superfamily)